MVGVVVAQEAQDGSAFAQVEFADGDGRNMAKRKLGEVLFLPGRTSEKLHENQFMRNLPDFQQGLDRSARRTLDVPVES